MVKRKSIPRKDVTVAVTPSTVSVASQQQLKLRKRKQDDKKKKTINVTASAGTRQAYTKAFKEIRRLQRTTHLLIPRSPFLRVIREIMMEFTQDSYRITAMAVEALREAAEWYLVATMEDAYQLAIHAKRVTLFPRDIELVIQLRRDFSSSASSTL